MASSCATGGLDCTSRKYSFHREAIKLGNRLPRAVAESPPSERFKSHVHVAFGGLVE